MRPSSISSLQRQLRDLAPDAVERREHDRLGRVVDDHVDAGQVLERADVAALAADDPALHVVGRELDHRDGRLGRVARGDALERVGDEVARAPLRLRLRLLLVLAHAPRELVPDQVLGALEQHRLRLADGHARDRLEQVQLALVRLLQLQLQLLRVRLAVGDALLAALQLGSLPLELVLARQQPLLALLQPPALVVELALEVGADLDRLLARLDLRLAPDGLGLARRLLEQLVARPVRRGRA